MEIERKFLLTTLPDNLSGYEHHTITQAYLCTSPVLRIRKWDSSYIFTYKSQGLMAREEVELPLDEASFSHLVTKADGTVIEKTRYCIPLGTYTLELDLFHGSLEGLIMGEIEFPSIEEANEFIMPSYFALDVTNDRRFHNSNMSKMNSEETAALLLYAKKITS